MIKEDLTPVIVDFGSSSLGNASSNCKDIMAFYNSVVRGGACNSSAVLEKYFKQATLDDTDRRKVITKNCKEILDKIKATPKITALGGIITPCRPVSWDPAMPIVDITYDNMVSRIAAIP